MVRHPPSSVSLNDKAPLRRPVICESLSVRGREREAEEAGDVIQISKQTNTMTDKALAVYECVLLTEFVTLHRVCACRYCAERKVGGNAVTVRPSLTCLQAIATRLSAR